MMMENLSMKNILWIIGGAVAGFSIGLIIGAIFGSLFWMLIALISGEFVFYSAKTVIVNTLFSVLTGILLSALGILASRRLFGSSASYLIWGIVGSAIGLIVMFSYGTNIIFHPEIYDYMLFLPTGNRIEPNLDPRIMSQVYYGAGTGQLIGAYLGTIMGLWISYSETIGRKRKLEDKKEFDEYSNFFKDRLKK